MIFSELRIDEILFCGTKNRWNILIKVIILHISFWSILFMFSRIGTDSKKLAYCGTKFEMMCDILACHLQALVIHCIAFQSLFIGCIHSCLGTHVPLAYERPPLQVSSSKRQTHYGTLVPDHIPHNLWRWPRSYLHWRDQVSTKPGVGVTKPISSVPLFS